MEILNTSGKVITIRRGARRETIFPNKKFEFSDDFFAIHSEYRDGMQVRVVGGFKKVIREQKVVPVVIESKSFPVPAITEEKNSSVKIKKKRK